MPKSKRSFSAERLQILSQLERWHFWFVGRRRLINRLLDRYAKEKEGLILDLGCGTGLMTENLVQSGRRTLGLDQRREGLDGVRQALPDSWLLQAESARLPLKEKRFQVVLILDVLEHVEELPLLTEVERILSPGGIAIITVPAMPWLWSYRDEGAGHLRRYTRRYVSGLFRESKLELQEMRYYQCLLFPLVVITRILGKKRSGSREFEERPLPGVNRILTLISNLEVSLSDVIPWPWGSTLAIVCQKDSR